MTKNLETIAQEAQEQLQNFLLQVIDEIPETEFSPELTKEKLFESIMSRNEQASAKVTAGFNLLWENPHTQPLLHRHKVSMSRLENINYTQDIMQDIFGISDQTMIQFYQFGTELFEKENCSQASDLFFFLAMFNATINSLRCLSVR